MKAAATPVDTKSLDMNFPEPSRRDPSLWTTTELARFLGCTERHIYHLRERGLPTIRLGSLVRFDPAEAMNWLKRQGKTAKLSSGSGRVTPAPEAAELQEGSATP
jgi:excisionase family DNA binding protein